MAPRMYGGMYGLMGYIRHQTAATNPVHRAASDRMVGHLGLHGHGTWGVLQAASRVWCVACVACNVQLGIGVKSTPNPRFWCLVPPRAWAAPRYGPRTTDQG
jgi:hypothetical protein